MTTSGTTTVTNVTPGTAGLVLGGGAVAGGGGAGTGALPWLVDVEIGGLTAVERTLETLASLAVENEDITLKAELVAEKPREVSVGVVPASDMVGVVGRPCAFELSLLTEL